MNRIPGTTTPLLSLIIMYLWLYALICVERVNGFVPLLVSFPRRPIQLQASSNTDEHRDINQRHWDMTTTSADKFPLDQDDGIDLESRRRIGMSLLQLTVSVTTGSKSTWAATSITDDKTMAPATSAPAPTSSRVREIRDPNTYPGLVYEPPLSGQMLLKPPPLLLVLHGAASNQEPSVRKALGDPSGEHAGLPMQLLASNVAPAELADNFCVAAPYSVGQTSFYNDARDKLLRFAQYLASNQIVQFDPTRIFLFGFSDGATVAVESATSRKFKAVVVCSYGFTGPSLPAMALQRLTGLSFWVWHSADDVIFDVGNSDRLVAALQQTNGPVDSEKLIRYTRFDSDPLPRLGRIPVDKSMRGHTMGIVAAQSTELYTWLLSLQQLQ